MSTSPKQEPELFSHNVKRAVRVVIDNPYPSATLFPGGKARRYRMTAPGVWSRVDNHPYFNNDKHHIKH